MPLISVVGCFAEYLSNYMYFCLQKGLVINHHARNTLTAFGKWAALQSEADSKNGGKFDYAVLLTRSVAILMTFI